MINISYIKLFYDTNWNSPITFNLKWLNRPSALNRPLNVFKKSYLLIAIFFHCNPLILKYVLSGRDFLSYRIISQYERSSEVWDSYDWLILMCL